MQILALVAVAAAAMQGASSSVYGPPPPVVRTIPDYAHAPSVSATVQQVLSDVHDGRENGRLSHKQAKELRREAGEIGILEERYARDGLSDDERAELQNRVQVIRAITNAKRTGVIK